MSVRAMAWAWEQELPEGEKLLLMAVADHADDQGVCWPGQESLGRKIGRSERTVRSRLKRLEALGLVAREPRYNAEGHRTSDRIILPITTGKLYRRQNQPAEAVVSGEPSGVSPTTGISTTRGNTPTSRVSTTTAERPKPTRKKKAREDTTPTLRVDRLVVTDDEMATATAVIETFNEEAGTAFTLVGTRGRPTEHLKRIVSRIRDYPEVDTEKHIEVVRYNCRKPWWGGKPTSVGVIYGPGSFPRCLAMDDGGGNRKFADERRTPREDAPW